MNYFNPYSGTNFFEFFKVLISRLFQGEKLVSDEIQILVLIAVSISSALVGTFLVLRRMTMLANALSHTILIGIVLAFIFTMNTEVNIQVMLFASLLTGLATTFLTEFLHKTLRLQGDASIALVFNTLFALGIILVTLLTRNAHIGTEVVMGNVDALQVEDLHLIWVITAANLLLFIVFFKEYQLTTFDQGLARTLGFSPPFFNYLLMVQVSATAIGAFRAVGVLMVLTFIVGPPLVARMLTHKLKWMLILACGIGIVASLFGVAFARHLLSTEGIALSTGGVTVCFVVVFYLITIGWSKCKAVLHL